MELDNLMKSLGGIGGIASMAAKNPQILAAAAALLSPKEPSVGGSGGLDGLLGMLNDGGLGDIASSWLGSGSNQSIGAEQLSGVLGNDTMGQFASKAGISLADAGPTLAAVLPLLIDQLSPKGSAPDSGSLEGMLGSFLGGR